MAEGKVVSPSAEAMILCSYGNFAWCGNNYNNKSGFYLSMNVDKTYRREL